MAQDLILKLTVDLNLILTPSLTYAATTTHEKCRR